MRYPAWRTVSIGAAGASFLRRRRTQTSTRFEPGVVAVAPHLGEQPLAAHDLAGVRDEVVEQPELAVGEIGRAVGDPRLAAGQIELDQTGAKRRRRRGDAVAPQVHADARDQLVERERLRQVVVRAELEAAQLRRQVGPRGQDQHRQLGPLRAQVVQQMQAVELRQQQIEDDELVRLGEGARKPDGSVLGAVDHKALGLESKSQEVENPGLVLDDQNAHRSLRPDATIQLRAQRTRLRREREPGSRR